MNARAWVMRQWGNALGELNTYETELHNLLTRPYGVEHRRYVEQRLRNAREDCAGAEAAARLLGMGAWIDRGNEHPWPHQPTVR